MNQNFKPSDGAEACVVDHLSDIFFGLVSSGAGPMAESEDLCVQAGHSLMAQALSLALERYDEELCKTLPEGVHVHDVRSRTLATKMGDVTFSYRRCRDAAGNTVIPLADALDLPWSSRVSPAARAFLVDAGAEVSFLGSSRLLASAGGSLVSAVTVMNAVHRTGELCEKEDEEGARSLYGDGVVPEGKVKAKDICIESDGTWIRLQNVADGEPRRVEVKGLVSYAGKQRKGQKVERTSPIRHGCVGTPEQFWTQGVAAIAGRFDLSEVEHAHFGCDGESFYKDGQRWLPIKSGSDTHLDPFHVNRAILSCFPANERRVANAVIGCAIDGGVDFAAALVEAACESGLAKKNACRVAEYLRSNKGIIYTGGPSLGTMESEQQHVYGARMDSVPCAWSVRGADAMARIRSRRFSKRQLPVPTRKHSVTPRRRKMTERRTMSYLETKTDPNVPMTVGRGTEAEHTASLVNCAANVRYAAAIDSGMVVIG